GLGPGRGVAHGLHGGDEQADEQGDDGDDDEQLDQREGRPARDGTDHENSPPQRGPAGERTRVVIPPILTTPCEGSGQSKSGAAAPLTPLSPGGEGCFFPPPPPPPPPGGRGGGEPGHTPPPPAHPPPAPPRPA